MRSASCASFSSAYQRIAAVASSLLSFVSRSIGPEYEGPLERPHIRTRRSETRSATGLQLCCNPVAGEGRGPSPLPGPAEGRAAAGDRLFCAQRCRDRALGTAKLL